MKNREVDEDNWEEYQKEVDDLYDKIPKKYQKMVSRINELELELSNLEGM